MANLSKLLDELEEKLQRIAEGVRNNKKFLKRYNNLISDSHLPQIKARVSLIPISHVFSETLSESDRLGQEIQFLIHKDDAFDKTRALINQVRSLCPTMDWDITIEMIKRYPTPVEALVLIPKEPDSMDYNDEKFLRRLRISWT